MIVVLIRSYNRPTYLSSTLRSIVSSLKEQPPAQFVVYDDGSTDAETLRILETYQDSFHVVLRPNNVGCSQSYLDALQYLRESWSSASHFAIVDNDIEVSPRWLHTLMVRYNEAEIMWPQEHILLSGFNPTNAHLDTQHNVQEHIHERSSVGAVCYFFSSSCLPDIERGWNGNDDWGVNELFHTETSHRMCGLNKGVVNHVGAVGLHSTPHMYDQDANFGDLIHNATTLSR